MPCKFEESDHRPRPGVLFINSLRRSQVHNSFERMTNLLWALNLPPLLLASADVRVVAQWRV